MATCSPRSIPLGPRWSDLVGYPRAPLAGSGGSDPGAPLSRADPIGLDKRLGGGVRDFALGGGHAGGPGQNCPPSNSRELTPGVVGGGTEGDPSRWSSGPVGGPVGGIPRGSRGSFHRGCRSVAGRDPGHRRSIDPGLDGATAALFSRQLKRQKQPAHLARHLHIHQSLGCDDQASAEAEGDQRGRFR